MPHNHPPRCCCELPDATADGIDITKHEPCTSCIEHGELAQLADNECPSCHQLPGRGPTDYCRQPRWHTTRGIVNEPQTYATKTTQPATRTTTPPTQTRHAYMGHHHPQPDCTPECDTTPLATPTPYHDAHPSECAHNTRGNDGTCYRCGAPRT